MTGLEQGVRFYASQLPEEEVARLKKLYPTEEECFPYIFEAYTKRFPSEKTALKLNNPTSGIEGAVQDA
ncbi:MAG: hypothetical protein ABSG05_00550 [Candidatus Pacearchaeota archaeon]|jgi:hypothetical protein